MTDASRTIAEARERLADTYYSSAHVSILRDTLRALIALAERALPDEPTEEALVLMEDAWLKEGSAASSMPAAYRALVAHLKQQKSKPWLENMSEPMKDSSLSPQVTQSDELKVALRRWHENRVTEQKLKCRVVDEPWLVAIIIRAAEAMLTTRGEASSRGWRILHGNEVYLCDDHQHFIAKIKELEREDGAAFKVERP